MFAVRDHFLLLFPSAFIPIMLRTAINRTTRQFPRLIKSQQLRSYAEAAKSEQLKLNFAVPHQSIFANKEVYVLHP